MNLLIQKITAVVFILLFLSPVYGQTGSVRGVVSDSETKERVPFATVALYRDGSSELLTGDVSDENGNFQIDRLPYGTYKLTVSFIGYQTEELDEITLNPGGPPVNLKNIFVSRSSTDLDEVEITGMARTASSHIDRTTYRAADFETTRGGTASDILNRLPQIAVNPDGDVSVRGASDFIVYLNGRPSAMSPSVLLSQISAGSVESIEIITVPGARYDAQGAGGIININTRGDALEGLSVSAALQGGTAPWSEYRDDYSGYFMNSNMYGGSIDLMYNSNMISLYSNLYLNERNVNGVRNGNARILQDNDSYYRLYGSGARPELHKSYSANAGIIAYLSERSTLDLSYFYARRNETRNAFYLYRGEGLLDGGSFEDGLDYWTYNPNTGERLGIIHTASLDLTHQVTGNSELRVMASYERSELNRDLFNPNYGYDVGNDRITEITGNMFQSDDTPLDGVRLYIQYQTKLNNGHTFDAGFQPYHLSNKGSFRYDTLSAPTFMWGSYTSLENDFELGRSVYAAYGNYSGNLGDLEFMGGIRMEYTDQVMDIKNPDYFSLFDRETKARYSLGKADWFPSIHMRYRIFQNDELTMAASRRINRPQTQNMAPFLYRRHHEVYEVGDPALEPEYLSNLELSYLKRAGNQSLRLTGFYRGTDNAVFRIYTVYSEENILIRSFTNAGRSTAIGAELNSDLVLGSFARLFLAGSLYHFNVQGEFFGYNEDNTSTNWSLKGNVNIFISKNLRLTSDFDLRSATVTAQGANEKFFLSSAALNYRPPGRNEWNLSIRLLDIFGTNITNWSTRAYDAAQRQIFFQETDYTRYGPVLEVGVTYSFNTGDKTLKRNVQTFGEEQF